MNTISLAIQRQGLDIANNLEDPISTSIIRVPLEEGQNGYYLNFLSDGFNWHVDLESSSSVVYGSKLIDFIREGQSSCVGQEINFKL